MQSFLRERQAKSRQSASSQLQNEPKRYEPANKAQRKSIGYYCTLCLLFFLPLTFIALYPYLRYSPMKAQYVKLPERVPFDGKLSQNMLLQKASYFGVGKFRGAESILFVNGTMYSGLLNGKIVRIDDNGNPHTITQSVDGVDETVCDDFGSYFESKKLCGRPLGLRFRAPNWIYFADAYYGIFKVNLDTNERILVFSAADAKLRDKPLMFANDLDLDDEGNIYFTDSSASRTVHEAVELYVEAVPDGRLFRYNEETQQLALLIDNLYFANGVQLTPQKDAVIVAETSMPRLTKYYVKGPKQGHREVFINLPGFADNIRASEHNTLLVGFSIARHPSMPSVLDLLGEYPLIRSAIGTVFNLRALMMSAPKYALVCEYDFNGDIMHSWHDPTGRVIQSVAGVTMLNKRLYLSSFYIDYIGVINYFE